MARNREKPSAPEPDPLASVPTPQVVRDRLASNAREKSALQQLLKASLRVHGDRPGAASSEVARAS